MISIKRFTIIDFDRVAARLSAEHDIPAHVEQTGGNVATLYVGTAEGEQEPTEPTMAYNHMADCMRAPVVLGPGWFEGPGWTNARGTLEELFLGPDDQGQTTHYEPESEDDIVETAAFLYDRVEPHLKCKPEDHPRDAGGAPKEVPRDKDDNLLCVGCGVPIFYCNNTEWYHHADITASVCERASR